MIDIHTKKRKGSKDNAKIDIKSQGERAKKKGTKMNYKITPITVNKMAVSTSVQFSSVAQSRLTLCDPMNCSMPGIPVHHQT